VAGVGRAAEHVGQERVVNDGCHGGGQEPGSG
jgi:hypothetical protein